MLQVELEADNIDLIGLSNSKINLLLRYGKVMDNIVNSNTKPNNTNNSQVDEKLIKYISNSFTTLENSLDTNITSIKKDSINKDDIKTFVSNINSTIEYVGNKINLKNSNANSDISEIIRSLDNNIKLQIRSLESAITSRSNDTTITKSDLELLEEKFKYNITVITNQLLEDSRNNSSVVSDKYRELSIKITGEIDGIRDKIVNDVKHNFEYSVIGINNNTRSEVLLAEQSVKAEINSLKLQIANDIGVKGLVAKFESFENFKQDIKRDITDFRTEFKTLFAKNKSKGDLCEGKVYNYLHENIMNYEIVDRSATPNMGDISIKNDKGFFCIECKNYSSNVPSREVDKFINTLDNNDYNAGVILNYNAGICNMKTVCEMKFTPNKKPYFALSKFISNPNLLLLSITMLEKWCMMKNIITKLRNELKVDDIQQKLQTANTSLKIVNDSRLRTVSLVTDFMNKKIKDLQDFMEMVIKINTNCVYIPV